MPEISAQDLRRLRALEGRLEKARAETRSFGAERRELRARSTAAERTATAAEKRAAEIEERVTALVEENARLAARLADIAADAERLRDAGTRLREQLDETKKSLRQAVSEEKKLDRALGKADAERERLTERLKLADAQLDAKTMTPVLPAKEVARLIDGFVSEIGGGLAGLTVREGEIRLNVAFGKAGRASGFVVPSADAPADVRKNLHEVAVRFDRTLDDAERQE